MVDQIANVVRDILPTAARSLHDIAATYAEAQFEQVEANANVYVFADGSALVIDNFPGGGVAVKTYVP